MLTSLASYEIKSIIDGITLAIGRYHSVALSLALFVTYVSTLYNEAVTQLTLAFLNTFQVTLDSQPITRFRSSNNQGMLVYLVMQADRAIPREVLATLFWPDVPESSARNNLRQSVYQLRKLLGDLDSRSDPYLLVTRQTVQFNPASNFTLDVNSFSQAIDAGDLEAAVANYHGDLLPGFTCDSLQFEEWLRMEREQLHQVALEAMFEVTQEHLRTGKHGKAKLLAAQQLYLEPWREQAHRQLMQAYSLAGDRGNAMAQFELCRKQLWEELGVEPSPETVALHEEIKAGSYGPVAFDQPIQPPVKARHNLPADTTPFIGRDLELAQLRDAITTNNERLVTIIGPGGIGKTRLALAVGRLVLDYFADGVYFVDLAPLSSPEEIIPAIAAELDFQASDSSKELMPQLLSMLSQARLLLIMDNYEHLVVAATLLTGILQSCPEVAILVTSRQRLNLASESRYELGGLEIPESLTPETALNNPAVKLFVDSGRRAQPHFSLADDNLLDVVHICQQVQGMPLALILASAWLELLHPAEIAVELKESLDILSVELADLPERQRNMQAVFEHSWEMITRDEQRVLADLTVFRGGFTREAAGEVARANLRILLSLVNKSLLQRQPDSGRFNMHELLRQFAVQKRLEAGDGSEVELAHCRYFSRLVDREERRALFFLPEHIAGQLSAERENVHQAWDYALEKGLSKELSELVSGVVTFTNARGIRADNIPQEAIQRLKTLGVPDFDPAMLRLRLVELGYRVEKDDRSQIRPKFLEFLPLLREKEELELLYWSYERLGLISFNDLPDNPETFEWYDKAYEIALEMNDEVFIKMTEARTIWARLGKEFQVDTPLAKLKELLAFFELDFSNSIVFFGILNSLSMVLLRQDEYQEAVRYAKRCLNLAQGWQNLFWIGFVTTDLAYIYLYVEQKEQAKRALLDGLRWHLAIGQRWQTLGYLWGLVYDFRQLLDFGLAIPLLSMVYHHPEAIPFYRQRIDGLCREIEKEIGVDAFAAAWEKGRALEYDSAVSQLRVLLEGGRTKDNSI